MGENAARIGKMRNTWSILVGKPEEKRPLGRPRRRWENNTKMYLRKTGCENVKWIHVAQDRVQWRADVKTKMNSRVP
jgi:hypothetical protein